MLQPLPPPQPPALIENAASEVVRDFSNSDHHILGQQDYTESRSDVNFNHGDYSSSLVSPQEQHAPEFSLGNTEEEYNSTSIANLTSSDSEDLPTQEQTKSTDTTEEYAPQTDAGNLGEPLFMGYPLEEKQGELPNTPNVLIPNLNQVQASQRTLILTQERGGETREFEITPLESEELEELEESETEVNEETQPPEETETEIPLDNSRVVEITSDQQEYDEERQVITAQGNVEMRFAQAVLTADRIEVNLVNRIAVAQGNVALVRGEQVLRGNRFEYFFVQDQGVIRQANGELYLPAAESDFSPTVPADLGVATVPNRPLSDRLAANQPLQRITSTDGFAFVLGSSRNVGNIPLPNSGGGINRLRFQAERVDFDSEGWQATDIRVTNDPFSPPELELRADTANFRNVAPLVDEITTSNSRIVLDQSFKVPIFQDRILLDRRPREPGLFSIGFDGGDRDGLFIERGFNVVDNQKVQLKITPQYFVQRAIFDRGVVDPSAFGFKTDLGVDLGPRTDLVGAAAVTSLDFAEIEDETRANVRLRQIIGNEQNPYNLSLNYSYRDRLFNGSLGFQTVQSSLGAVLLSPNYTLGDSKINFRYQGGVQLINAETNSDDDLETLVRTQGALFLGRGFLLWQGGTLPPTREEGLRYTPQPVQPFIRLNTGLSGVANFYSNGDRQQALRGSIGIQGQFGHFSRPYLDYTGFNITYNQSVIGGRSPFRFDRAVDSQTLSAGIVQQIYGPFRLGLQASYSINRDRAISTDFFVEYSRRTYSVLVRYNPTLELGSFSFRVNDFNWVGSPEPFDN